MADVPIGPSLDSTPPPPLCKIKLTLPQHTNVHCVSIVERDHVGSAVAEYSYNRWKPIRELWENYIFLIPKQVIQRRRWLDNIKMDLREIGWDGVDWIDMAQDRDQWRALVNTVLKLRVP
jgi:hypothetical protein